MCLEDVFNINVMDRVPSVSGNYYAPEDFGSSNSPAYI